MLSAIGVILTLHLWVQKERNFDRGCWGAGETTPIADHSGCRDPRLAQAQPDSLLSIPLAAWGYGMYLFVGALAFGGILANTRTAQWLHLIAETVLGGAVPFCLYLIYIQVFVIRAYCPLCLVSDGLTVGLFILHLIQHRRGFDPVQEETRGLEIGYASGILFVATAMMFGLLLFVDQVGTRRLDRGDSAEQFETMMDRSLPKFIDSARLAEMKPALFDERTKPIEPKQWLQRNTPVLGSADGVTVLVFLDPNCPHCRDTFAVLKKLGQQFGSRIGIYIMPRVLWDFPFMQSLAILVAGEEGKYFDMWELQLERQKKGGLSLEEIEKLFQELGLQQTGVAQHLETARAELTALRERAIEAGINQTPSIYINGRALAANSRDEKRLAILIERAESAALEKRKSAADKAQSR